MNKVSKMPHGKLQRIRSDINKLLGVVKKDVKIIDDVILEDSECMNGDGLSEKKKEEDVLLMTFDDILDESKLENTSASTLQDASSVSWVVSTKGRIDVTRTMNSSGVSLLEELSNPDEIERYLQQQENNLRFSIRSTDPELLSKLSKMSHPRKFYTLHMYHVFFTKNENLALENINEYFNSLSQQVSKKHAKKAFLDEEETMNLLR